MDNPPSSTAATTRTRHSVGSGAIRELCNRSQTFASRYKRLKSLAQLGHLPKADDQSARTWLDGKLFVALLTEQLIRRGQTLSPCRPTETAREATISLARVCLRLAPDSACDRTGTHVTIRA